MEKINYKALCLEKFKGQLLVKNFTLRDLEDDELLIKIIVSTIMPADLALLQGTYGSFLPNPPFTPGMEAAGIIEKVGKNIDINLIGKKVSVTANSSEKSYNGLWSQYTLTKLDYLIVFDKEVEFEKIFNSQGNPLTAVGFIETIKKHGKKSVAHNGASSAFGRIFMRLCIDQGIECINIVRKESSIKELTELGGKHFINTSDKDWNIKLKQKCEELDVSILFDCCGGDITGHCLKAIKNNGILYHFGNLELKRLGEIDPKEFSVGGKRMQGWWLFQFLIQFPNEDLKKWKDYIKKDFEENKVKIFDTSFNADKFFTLEEVEKAFETYMVQGKKILFKPWGY